MPAAFPADHDDYGCLAVRNTAHRIGVWRRSRCPAAARAGGGRWPGGFAVPYAVHHACRVPLHGAIAGLVRSHKDPQTNPGADHRWRLTGVMSLLLSLDATLYRTTSTGLARSPS